MTVHLSTNVFYFILWAIVIILFIDGSIRGFLRVKKNMDYQTMSIPYTESMKGLMAASILLGHYALRLDGLGSFVILRSIGLPAVTAFLFISGYCETVQFTKRKEEYFDGFVLKKILRIYIPWLLLSILVAIIFGVSDFFTLVKGFLGLHVLYRANTPNWFVMYILYCYLSLFVYHLFAKVRGRVQRPGKLYFFIILIFSSIWFVVCTFNGLENNWYTNSFTFLIGCLFAFYKDKLKKTAQRHSLIQTVILGGMAGICMLLPAIFHDNIIFVNAIRIINTLIVSALIWQISITFDSHSSILRLLGKQSLEIFCKRITKQRTC